MRLQPGLGPSEMTTRVIWHALPQRNEWGERIQRCSNEIVKAERQSVLEGVRNASQQCLTPMEYHNVQAWAIKNGLHVYIRRSVKKFFGFAHRYEDGEGYYVTVVAKYPWFLENPNPGLGYPECCEEWFNNTFPMIIDPMWQWAGGLEEDTTTLISGQSPYANPLLRYVNIRFSPHIPCHHACEKSHELGYEMARLIPEPERGWVHQLLSQPITWDCYRGISIVKTNQFRIVQSSVPSAERYIVETRSG